MSSSSSKAGNVASSRLSAAALHSAVASAEGLGPAVVVVVEDVVDGPAMLSLALLPPEHAARASAKRKPRTQP